MNTLKKSIRFTCASTVVAVTLVILGATPAVAGGPVKPNPASVILQPLDCALEGSIASVNSKKPTQVRFFNETSGTIDVFWLDYEGQRELFRSLPPGETGVVHTFVTHPWLIINERDQCLAVFLPDSRHGLADCR